MSTGKGNIEAIYGLSPMQEGILFHTIHAPESGLYFEQYSCTLTGPLDGSSLERAWQHIADRHPALRSLFTWERRDKPLQIVRQQVTLPWTHEDWRELAPSAQTERLETRLLDDRARAFTLDRAPLMRFALFRTGETTHHFLWSFHHLLLDGWSMLLILDEVFRTYESFREDRDPALPAPRPYRDYIGWLQRQDLTEAETFWRRTLAGFTAPTPLRIESRALRSPWAEHHDTVELILPEATTTALDTFTREHRLTMNTLVRGVWALFLSRYSDGDDIVFGATVSGRPPELEGVEEIVGLMINTVPVRAKISDDDSLVPWLSSLQRAQYESTAFDATPLVKVQRWSDVEDGPLFQTVLVVQNHPVDPDAQAGRSVRVGDARYIEQSNFPLALIVMPGRRFEFILVYDRERFDADAIQRMAGHLETLLTQMVQHPEARLGELTLLPDRERQRILVDWNDTGSPTPGEPCIHHLIRTHAQTSPDSVAVEFEGATLTYGELLERAGRFARQLQSLGVRPGSCVGISVERSIEMVVGIVAILESGGAYVPIDPEQPAERTRFMLEDTGARALLTTRAIIPSLPSGDVAVICLDDDPDATDLPLDDRATADDLAYVIYTSGSTGMPKGVEVTHGNLVHSTSARFHHYPEKVTRYCLLSPFVFDSSVAGLFWTLAQGGALVLPSPRMEQDVHALTTLLAESRATHMLALPALYALILELAEPTQLRSLETVVLAGEACPPDVVRTHFRRLPDTALYNEYGPTEATVWCTVHRVRPEDAEGRVPIGRPVAHTQVYILDHALRPVPIGVPGELCVGGAGVARGYLNRPEQTAERFIDHPIEGVGHTRLYRTGDRARFLADGTIEFLGRVDHQVKIRGHRIELGEVETALGQHPAVRDAVVVLDGGREPMDAETVLARLGALSEAEADGLLREVEGPRADTEESLA